MLGSGPEHLLSGVFGSDTSLPLISRPTSLKGVHVTEMPALNV